MGKNGQILLKNHFMNIYKTDPCLSPYSIFAIHCANINSIFGISPNVDWEKIWDDNKVKGLKFQAFI